VRHEAKEAQRLARQKLKALREGGEEKGKETDWAKLVFSDRQRRWKLPNHALGCRPWGRASLRARSAFALGELRGGLWPMSVRGHHL